MITFQSHQKTMTRQKFVALFFVFFVFFCKIIPCPPR